MEVTIPCEEYVGEMNANQIYDAFYDKTKRRLIRITSDRLEDALRLVRSIDERKKLLSENGILTNPYNLK